MAVKYLKEGVTFIGSLGGVGSTSAQLLGIGTESAPFPGGTAAATNLIGIWTQSKATTGDSRGIYFRHYLQGTGISGECARFYATVQNVQAGASVHGAHISLGFGTTGGVTGLGVAMRATLHVPDKAVTTGTLASIQAEIWMDGTSSTVAAVANSFAPFRVCINGGDATAQGTVKTFMILDVPNQGDGALINSNSSIIAYSVRAALKVVQNAKTFYIPLIAAS